MKRATKQKQKKKMKTNKQREALKLDRELSKLGLGWSNGLDLLEIMGTHDKAHDVYRIASRRFDILMGL